ncbi:16S rRNA (guanine(527)-N(7))-methyltransferase RsmG [Jannaschia sp. 2305UL9-9]|uniref:16S rRNA (guanine(527)-N(7))-methyltransferase RsmG n=1 Tax=Jannaschia sp. 2305UL9-9 TaxID=3121638 RepID=UPI0035272780
MSAAQNLDDVSRETLDRLEDLVRRWNSKINLIAPSTLTDIRNRHSLDAAAVSNAVAHDVSSWVDLGSGGGFPGLVVSILRPSCKVTLVESDGRKAAFLRTAKRELGLNAQVIADRIEAVPPLNAEIVSARALAPLPLLLEYALRHGTDGTRYLFPKGKNWEAEHDLASVDWAYDLNVHDGAPASDGKILELTNLRRRNG